jgi:enoyl-CoA hydratase
MVLLESRPIAGCTLLTLNRPQVKNALSAKLRGALADAFLRLAGSEAARVLVLTGAGDAFCAGLDLKELGAAAPGRAIGDGSGSGAAEPHLDVVAAMRRFPGPIIGAINGVAVTGGFEIALNCDVLLASTSARFADTHARVGVMPGWGLSQLLPRTIGAYRAKELSLTGNFLPAERALEWGLVNRVVAPERLLPDAVALAADMLGVLPHMLTAYKRVIDEGLALPLAAALEMERERSRAGWSSVAAADIERRRRDVRARGQQQSHNP